MPIKYEHFPRDANQNPVSVLFAEVDGAYYPIDASVQDGKAVIQTTQSQTSIRQSELQFDQVDVSDDQSYLIFDDNEGRIKITITNNDSDSILYIGNSTDIAVLRDTGSILNPGQSFTTESNSNLYGVVENAGGSIDVRITEEILV